MKLKFGLCQRQVGERREGEVRAEALGGLYSSENAGMNLELCGNHNGRKI